MPLPAQARLAAIRGVLEDIERLLAAPRGGWRLHGSDAIPVRSQMDEALRAARLGVQLTGKGR